MRAAWWLLKLVWRAATRVRRALERPTFTPCAPGEFSAVLGGQLGADEAPPRANLAEWLEGQPLDVAGEAQSLAAAYARTFCGKCGAGPQALEHRRCPACLELLAKVLGELHGDEPRKLAEIARLAREGRL